MRFLVDESTGPSVARWLRDRGHNVVSVYENMRGAEDDAILRKAEDEDRILITADKDFGEKTFRDRRPHRGVVLLRLEDQRARNRTEVISKLLARYHHRLPGEFVVVTEKRVRFARSPER